MKIIWEVIYIICVIIFATIMLVGIETIARAIEGNKDQTQLIQPPNYNKESLLELLEKGECIGGTIEEGKFSVFVCKE